MAGRTSVAVSVVAVVAAEGPSPVAVGAGRTFAAVAVVAVVAAEKPGRTSAVVDEVVERTSAAEVAGRTSAAEVVAAVAAYQLAAVEGRIQADT